MVSSEDVVSGASLFFNTAGTISGTGITFIQPSNSITIAEPGDYKITFTFFTNSTSSIWGMNINDVAATSPYSFSSGQGTAQAIVTVLTPNSVLQITNVGESVVSVQTPSGLTFQDVSASLVIEKLN